MNSPDRNLSATMRHLDSWSTGSRFCAQIKEQKQYRAFYHLQNRDVLIPLFLAFEGNLGIGFSASLGIGCTLPEAFPEAFLEDTLWCRGFILVLDLYEDGSAF